MQWNKTEMKNNNVGPLVAGFSFYYVLSCSVGKPVRSAPTLKQQVHRIRKDIL